MSDISNPWREFIENCISGSNYFRAREYMDLLADLDRGYTAEAECESLRKDAERYRWLRDATGWSIQQWLGLSGVWTEYLSGKNLDITIDAAMEASHDKGDGP